MSAESDTTFRASDAGLTIAALATPGDARRVQLRLAGDIDLATFAVLSDTVEWLRMTAPVSVLVDLAAVTFAGSALANFVVRVTDVLPGGAELILWRARPTARLVLRVTGMATIATVIA